MFKIFAVAALMGLASIGSAATVYSNCTSPTADANPPASGFLPASTCSGWQTAVNGVTVAPAPSGTIDFITLLGRASVTLQIGGNNAGADLSETTNLVPTNWNAGPVTTTTPPGFMDFTKPVDCSTNAAACAAALAALNANTVTVTGSFGNLTGTPSGISADFAWQVDFTPTTTGTPEPATFALLGAGLLGLGLLRRKVI